MAIGHSSNKAACIAISTAIQTAAAIARALMLAERVALYDNANEEPTYDLEMLPHEQSRQIVAGLMASFAAISRTAGSAVRPTFMAVSDQRKDVPETIAFGRGDDLPDQLKAFLPLPAAHAGT